MRLCVSLMYALLTRLMTGAGLLTFCHGFSDVERAVATGALFCNNKSTISCKFPFDLEHF